MKRLNRNKILGALEEARWGFAGAIQTARRTEDKVGEMSFNAHHRALNKMIVELGGEDVRKDNACYKD